MSSRAGKVIETAIQAEDWVGARRLIKAELRLDPHRALAGLSMGGLQTLNVALDDSADFAYVGVFSSGWFPNSIKEEQDTDVAQYRASGKPFRLFWVDAGKYDIALQNSHATVAVLKDAGINVEEHESGGFHAWPNRRDYLHQFASLVFKSPEAH